MALGGLEKAMARAQGSRNAVAAAASRRVGSTSSVKGVLEWTGCIWDGPQNLAPSYVLQEDPEDIPFTKKRGTGWRLGEALKRRDRGQPSLRG